MLFDVWITSMRLVFYVTEALRFLVLVLTYPKIWTDLIGQPKEQFLMIFWMHIMQSTWIENILLF